MIIDYIPFYFKINKVNTIAPLWYDKEERNPCNEAFMLMGREINHGLENFVKFKVIETLGNLIIERTFVMDESLVENPFVQKKRNKAYPISSKFYRIDNNRIISTELIRHINGIKSLLNELTGECIGSKMMSVHQLLLQRMYNHAVDVKDHFIQDSLLRYSSIKHNELIGTCVADDMVTDNLFKYSDYIVESVNDLSSSANSEAEAACLISDILITPSIGELDTLSRKISRNPEINLGSLKDHCVTKLSRPISLAYEENSPFRICGDVSCNIPKDAIWSFTPIINKLEALPFTDVEMVYSEGVFSITKASTCYGLEITDSNYLKTTNAHDSTDFLTAAALGIRTLVHTLRLPISLKTTKCLLVKNFNDEVYLTIIDAESGRSWKFFFDIVLIALGTRGLIDTCISERFSEIW